MLAVNPLHRNISGGCCKTHGGERERGSSRSAAHPQSQCHAHVLALPHPMSQWLLSTYRASFSSQSSCPPRHLPHSSPLAKPPLKLCIGREERAIVDSEVGKVLAMNHVKFSTNSHGVDLPALKPKIAIFFVIEPIRTLKQSFLLCCHPCHSFQRQRPRSRTAPPSRTLFRRRSRVVLFLQSGQSSRPMSSSCQRFVRPSPISHHPLKSTTLPSIAIPRVVVTTFRWTIRRDGIVVVPLHIA